MIKIGHLNVHNDIEPAEVALGWGCHSLGVDETGKGSRKVIRRAEGYNTFAVPGAEDAERTSLGTAILVQERFTTTAGIGLLIAKEARPARIAPNRWVYGIGYESNDIDIFHAEFHNHAAVDNKTPNNVRVARHEAAVRRLGKTMLFFGSMGYAGVVTGDLNTRDVAKSVGWQDAGEMFRAIDYAYEDFGLDWIAWNPALLEMVDIIEVPKTVTKSDHAGIIGKFQPV